MGIRCEAAGRQHKRTGLTPSVGRASRTDSPRYLDDHQGWETALFPRPLREWGPIVMTVQIRSDPVRTRQRIAELEQYMSAHVSGPAGFCCTSESECRASALMSPRTGQLRADTS